MLGNAPLSAAPLGAFGGIAAPATLRVAGYTRTRYGDIEPSCVVKLFRTADDAVVATTTSSAGGYYEFINPAGEPFYAVAYKDGSPDITGSTANTLVAT